MSEKYIQLLPANGYSAYYEGDLKKGSGFYEITEEPLLFWGLTSEGNIHGLVLEDFTIIASAYATNFLCFSPSKSPKEAFKISCQKHGFEYNENDGPWS